MVTIIDFKTTQSDGKEYNMLIVQGGVEPLTSSRTGKLYLTMPKAYVSTTFDKKTCKSLVGTQLPGTVKKVDVEPYKFKLIDSDEEIELSHSWEYVNEAVTRLSDHIVKTEDVY